MKRTRRTHTERAVPRAGKTLALTQRFKRWVRERVKAAKRKPGRDK